MRESAAAGVDLVVVGAGIAGLTVAYDAARAGLDVVVLEAGTETGGLLRRGELGGLAIDLGAESFATRTTGVADLIADLNADAQLALRTVDPAPGGAHLAVAGEVGVIRAPLPRRTVLGIPADPAADDVVRILGEAGARRAAAEALLPIEVGDIEPSLAELVTQRCGEAVARRLVDPLCRSVYSQPATAVRLSQLQPALWREFHARGSLTAAAAALAPSVRPGAAVAGIAGGMWQLVAALHTSAVRHGAGVHTGARVRALTARGGSVEVVADGGAWRARQVVVATGSTAARTLLGEPESPTPPVRVVGALVDSPALDVHPVGSGVIVADGVPSAAKALTHVTAKWAWAREAVPAGRHIVRLSARDATAGGLDTPAGLAREISLLTGVSVDAGDIVEIVAAAWHDAVAAPAADPQRQAVLARSAIHQAGAVVAGTGLASVVPHARALALDLIASLSAPRAVPTRRTP